mgnify:CR=1 FL=1
MENYSKYLAVTIIAICLVFSTQQFYMGLHETESPDSLYNFWAVIFTVLIAWWCDKDREGKSWPFEFGYFVFIFWPVILPFYLFKTRGVDGLVMFAGFCAMYISPNITWLVGYQYS